jgi:hypothetical protein
MVSLVDTQIVERRDGADSGIAEEYVESAEALTGQRDQGLQVLLPGHVGANLHGRATQVLNALAAALRLDRHERDHLLHLAGHAPAGAAEEHEPLTAEADAVPVLLQPNPAYIIGGIYDVLSHNQAAEELFPRLITEADRPANFVRWVFLEPMARDVLVDWEPEARGLLGRLRTLAGRHSGDPRYTRLIKELSEASPEVRDWWPQYEVQARHSGRKRLRHPHRGAIDYAYTAFHLAEQPEQTLVIYVDSSEPPDGGAAVTGE